MTKGSLSSPSSPPPQPVSHLGQPNAGRDDDNQSVPSHRSRKRDWLRDVFRPSSQKPKATNSTSTNPKYTTRGTSTRTEAASRHLVGIGTPGSVDIDHVVAVTTVKTAPSDVHPPSPLLTTPRLDVFPRNFKAPSVRIALPKFGA
ncbi:hypothetical protein BGZ97_010890, partial [Linnemannia gamsii]